MRTKAVLTDIEGTTSSIAFVHDVLFPYAREHLPRFVADHAEEPAIASLIDDVRREAGKAASDIDEVVAILKSWIDEDRKATPLKALQGHVWKHGYEAGDFTGHIYDDAAANLRRWASSGVGLYVYSSGSVAAQKLLFGYSDAGDLTSLFSGYFDTRIGHKKEAASYGVIVDALAAQPDEVLFLSDVVEELDAATTAGMRTIQLVRDDAVVTGSHPVATTFDDVIID